MRFAVTLVWVVGACGRLGFDAQRDDAGIDGGVSSTITLATGGQHSCALLAGGRVRCWGNNSEGELGYGNTDSVGDNEPPASAGDVAIGGSVLQVTAGFSHSCALLVGGGVRCWGNGNNGRLGYGNESSIGDDELPLTAGDVDVGGPAVQVAAGRAHTCALLADGTVRCWGEAADGQLGYGNTSNIGNNETPASAGSVDIGGVVTQIVAGDDHNCVLLVSGAVRCWGDGGDGRLGYGNTSNIGNNETPASAGDVQIGGPVAQLAASDHHTCAVLVSGTVKCWGEGLDGRLGYGNLDDIGDGETPMSVTPVQVGGTAVAITAGLRHTCVLLDTGAVRCWGDGSGGRLGYGNTSDIGDNEPPSLAGDVMIGGSVVFVSAGDSHNCAVLVDGRIRCWGISANGRLGYAAGVNVIGNDELPSTTPVTDIGGSADTISAGGDHTCVRLVGSGGAGSVTCWGPNSSGQVGHPGQDVVGDTETAASVGPVAIGGGATAVATGHAHTCSVLATGAVRCWGDGSNGRLGYASTSDIGDDETPAVIGDVVTGSQVVEVSLGTDHTCAIRTGGAVQCWGNNDHGQLGYGNTTVIGDDETPATAGTVNLGGVATQISMGDENGCALLSGGAVRCWGEANDGELGHGNTDDIGDNETPASAGDVPLGGTATQIAFGSEHVCAVLSTGAVRCWGDGTDGKLGYIGTNDIGDNETPAAVGDVNVGFAVAKVAAGKHHTCAMLTDGRVRCWGRGAGGRLGYGNISNIGDDEAPAAAGDVAIGGTAIAITAGDEHTCAILSTREVRCWGADGGYGRLGLGTDEDVGDDELPSSVGDVNVE